MKAWILGLTKSQKVYRIHLDMNVDGVTTLNEDHELIKLDVENDILVTDKGTFEIIGNYREFCALEDK